MARKNSACAFAGRLEQRADGIGQVNGLPHVARAAPPAPMLPGEVARSVLKVSRQHLVTRRKPKRTGDDVDTRGRILDKRQVLGPGADEIGERTARLYEQVVQAPGKKLH